MIGDWHERQEAKRAATEARERDMTRSYTTAVLRSPLAAFRDACRRHLIRVPEHAELDIVNAVLSAADSTAHVVEMIHRRMWENNDYMEHVRREMRYKLLAGIVDSGRIPVSLPVETRTYHTVSWRPDKPGYQIPDEVAEATGEWDEIRLTLSCPVRTPPIDRDAAVKAGIVYPGGK